ncbi:MAG: EVE domain-containing protein [Acidobacteriota bacterium]|jgi:predicted RNA-binding protein with PUA-like domain
MTFWLIKSEPSAYSWDDLNRDGSTAWDGVRNYQARNNLRAMKKGDLALYYHSVSAKEIVGVARVTREAFPDPTAREGDWSAVGVAPAAPMKQPVSLSQIKQTRELADMALLRQSRLSVCPVARREFEKILSMGGLDRAAVGL